MMREKSFLTDKYKKFDTKVSAETIPSLNQNKGQISLSQTY